MELIENTTSIKRRFTVNALDQIISPAVDGLWQARARLMEHINKIDAAIRLFDPDVSLPAGAPLPEPPIPRPERVIQPSTPNKSAAEWTKGEALKMTLQFTASDLRKLATKAGYKIETTYVNSILRSMAKNAMIVLLRKGVPSHEAMYGPVKTISTKTKSEPDVAGFIKPPIGGTEEAGEQKQKRETFRESVA